jgi:hypothetical protein
MYRVQDMDMDMDMAALLLGLVQRPIEPRSYGDAVAYDVFLGYRVSSTAGVCSAVRVQYEYEYSSG